VEGDKLYLLPVQGSDTQWYKNLLKNPSIRIEAGGAAAELNAVPVTDTTRVVSVAEKFRDKYGARDVKKYYFKVRRWRPRPDALSVCYQNPHANPKEGLSGPPTTRALRLLL
jgi:hypothetical protein